MTHLRERVQGCDPRKVSRLVLEHQVAADWESCSLSPHSPELVQDSEVIGRFVYDPSDIENGKPSYAHLAHLCWDKGYSVQRVRNDPAGAHAHAPSRMVKYLGYLPYRAEQFRGFLIKKVRGFVVCDTAYAENPNHAEVFFLQRLSKKEEADMRWEVLKAIDPGAVVPPPAIAA